MKFWTPPEIKRLRKMWNQGLTLKVIATRMSKSKGAVAGATRRYCETRIKRQANKFDIKPVRQKTAFSSFRPKYRHVKLSKTAKTAYGTPKHLKDVGEHDCRWPIDTDDGIMFCCAPTNGEHSYCRKHRKISTVETLNPTEVL